RKLRHGAGHLHQPDRVVEDRQHLLADLLEPNKGGAVVDWKKVQRGEVARAEAGRKRRREVRDRPADRAPRTVEKKPVKEADVDRGRRGCRRAGHSRAHIVHAAVQVDALNRAIAVDDVAGTVGRRVAGVVEKRAARWRVLMELRARPGAVAGTPDG